MYEAKLYFLSSSDGKSEIENLSQESARSQQQAGDSVESLLNRYLCVILAEICYAASVLKGIVLRLTFDLIRLPIVA